MILNTLLDFKNSPKTLNQALTTLIPKKKGNNEQLKYWRPISLLCVNYKILTKILANRVKYVLSETISEQQNYSVPKRTIFNNLFLVRDIIRFIKERKQQFLLITNCPRKNIS